MVYGLKISYRGTHYAGWQRQTNATTVQQVVEEALSEVLGDAVRLTAAGRTDAGVHALGQFANFEVQRDFPLRGLTRATNGLLPEDVRILSAHRMPSGFNARKHAKCKEYRYRLERAEVVSPLDALFALRVWPAPDLPEMARATQALAGRHDFSAFALSGGSHKSPDRELFEAEWIEEGDTLTLRLVGDGFLRGMVRSLVGTLLEVGRGRRSSGDFARLLGGAARSEAGPTAEPQGLHMMKVEYPQQWQPIGE